MTTERNSKDFVFYPFSPTNEEYGNWFVEQHKLHWSWGEFQFLNDASDYDKLTPELRNIFDTILAYFSFTDGIVAENCLENFGRTSRSIECKAAYAAQSYIEYIHAMTYSKAIEAYVRDEKRRIEIFDSYNKSEFVQDKTKWAEMYMDTSISEPERLVAYACTEGIFFISAFAFIFYLKSKDIFPIFGNANQAIARDECLHVDLSIMRYNIDYKDNKLSEDIVHNIIKSSVELEKRFIDNILPNSIEDLIPYEIKLYIETLADGISYRLGYSKIYNTELKNIPPWLSVLSLVPKVNFYEAQSLNYRQVSTNDGKQKSVDIHEIEF